MKLASDDIDIGENLAILVLGIATLAVGCYALSQGINGSVTMAVFGAVQTIVGFFIGKKKGSGEEA
ncbi:MAG: hypothetical protein ACFFCO_12260 [Promethearchaeota archaeon]